MTERKRDAARQSPTKPEESKTNAGGTVGRRSFLKGAELFAGGTAAGAVASPLLGSSKAQTAAKARFSAPPRPAEIDGVTTWRIR
jgi:hypothetical protein